MRMFHVFTVLSYIRRFICVLIKHYRTKGQKKAGETIKETSRSVRPDRVDKCPNSMLAR